MKVTWDTQMSSTTDVHIYEIFLVLRLSSLYEFTLEFNEYISLKIESLFLYSLSRDTWNSGKICQISLFFPLIQSTYDWTNAPRKLRALPTVGLSSPTLFPEIEKKNNVHRPATSIHMTKKFKIFRHFERSRNFVQIYSLKSCTVLTRLRQT